jgi:Domain of unknown function (DUF1707)
MPMPTPRPPRGCCCRCYRPAGSGRQPCRPGLSQRSPPSHYARWHLDLARAGIFSPLTVRFAGIRFLSPFTNRGKVNEVSERDRDLRVSDAERDAVVKTLGEHASVGRLTLDELEDRSSKALEAKTRGELDALTRDLPDGGTPVAQTKQRRPVRWMVSILSGATFSGRSRAVGTINALAILGGGEIDLRNTQIEGGELSINSFAILGGPDIFVPDTIEVDHTGFMIIGGIDDHGPVRTPRPGAPVVKVRAFGVLAGANIYRVPPELRDLSARQIRKRLHHERDVIGPGDRRSLGGGFGDRRGGRGPFGGGFDQD